MLIHCPRYLMSTSKYQDYAKHFHPTTGRAIYLSGLRGRYFSVSKLVAISPSALVTALTAIHVLINK